MHVKIFCFKSLNYYLKNAQKGKNPLGWNYALKRKSGRNKCNRLAMTFNEDNKRHRPKKAGYELFRYFFSTYSNLLFCTTTVS